MSVCSCVVLKLIRLRILDRFWAKLNNKDICVLGKNRWARSYLEIFQKSTPFYTETHIFIHSCSVHLSKNFRGQFCKFEVQGENFLFTIYIMKWKPFHKSRGSFWTHLFQTRPNLNYLTDLQKKSCTKSYKSKFFWFCYKVKVWKVFIREVLKTF